MESIADQAPLGEVDFNAINRAFSKQSAHYDADDQANSILNEWRKQVYAHVSQFLRPSSHILELNSGTGIDALHFIGEGHRVHCTDLSDGMIDQIEKKRLKLNDPSLLTVQQCSFDSLNHVEGKFDYVFSNFGGLNCLNDLSIVTRSITRLLKPGAFATWIIMPPVCLWEISWIFRGHRSVGMRRFHKNGTMAHLEGEYFKTYYFSLHQIKNAFGKNFRFMKSEGLGALTPPPSEHQFPKKHPHLHRMLNRLDGLGRHHFPFNRWADHIIVTMQFKDIDL